MSVHGHLDPEADPSFESNVTIHGHAGGDKPHRHKNAPAWGAIGSQYVSESRASAILERKAPSRHDTGGTRVSEELRPISYQGFGNMLQRAFGSYWMDPVALRGKTIASVAVSDDKERLIFTLDDGRTITYRAVGDCCSSSWIEHLTVPPDIAGSEVTAFGEQDMGEFEQDYETIRLYQTSFATPKGEIVVEYRNSSNGYYGGWLEGPVEEWARDDATAQRNAGLTA